MTKQKIVAPVTVTPSSQTQSKKEAASSEKKQKSQQQVKSTVVISQPVKNVGSKKTGEQTAATPRQVPATTAESTRQPKNVPQANVIT